MLIYTGKVTERTLYTFRLVFHEIIGVDYQVTTDANLFTRLKCPKLSYGLSAIENEYYIKSHELLFRTSTSPINVEVTAGAPPHLFTTHCELGFDVFAAVFFMVSRYEEYTTNRPDKCGRFQGCESLAFKHNFLELPVVNIWVKELAEALKLKYPQLEWKKKKFSALMTYDIDLAYKYSGRSFFRSSGGLLRDAVQFKRTEVCDRLLVALKLKKDPWDVYEDLMQNIDRRKIPALFFFLLADRSEKDRNIRFYDPMLIKLIHLVHQQADVGIHPSFYSGKNILLLQKEKQRIEKIVGERIIKSRQHYLRFFLPETYLNLLEQGIEQDYTMVFHDVPGFRAGICTPFFFYDLKNEKATKLKIFPAAFMEGNFFQMNFSPEQSLRVINELVEVVASVNGLFISIWHNHTISNTKQFKDWKMVHDNLLDKIHSYEDH